jgi:NADPH:quinone reductase-like Zn-dependent oxidoreductase
VKAVIQHRYGTVADLHIAEVAQPQAGPGQVVVGVRATSVHADVWHVLTGRPYLVARPLAGGLRRPRNPIPGTDLAGVVTEVGTGASRFSVGDRVFGEVVKANQWNNGGTFAEYAAVDESMLEPVPDTVSFVDAAAIPTSGLIAYNQVSLTRIGAGDRVLVNGAAGGVGLFVVQIAVARGALVTAVDAADRETVLRSCGIERFIDYRRTDFTSENTTYDAIVDIPGNQPLGRIGHVLADEGRYVLVGHDQYGTAGRWLGSLPAVLSRTARQAVRTRRLPSFAPVPHEALVELARMAGDGSLHPVVAATFPLVDVREALELMMSGTAVGKIVLTV